MNMFDQKIKAAFAAQALIFFISNIILNPLMLYDKHDKYHIFLMIAAFLFNQGRSADRMPATLGCSIQPIRIKFGKIKSLYW
jgi:hypothetical protein